MPEVINPKAMLSVCVLLSNAKSFIISVRCLNNSIPEPNKSLFKTYVTDGVIVIFTGPLSLTEPWVAVGKVILSRISTSCVLDELFYPSKVKY